MTIRTKNQVELAGDVPSYGGEYGGATLDTDFMIKFNGFEPDGVGPGIGRFPATKVSPLAPSKFTWGSVLGSQTWDSGENKVIVTGTDGLLEWDNGMVDVGASDDVVMIVVAKLNLSNDLSSFVNIGAYASVDGIKFSVKRTQVNAAVSGAGQRATYPLTIPEAEPEVAAFYFRGVAGTDFTGDSGWRVRSDSSLTVKGSDIAHVYSGALTMDLTPGSFNNSQLQMGGCEVYSVFCSTYPTGDSPSLTAVQEAAQWHIDNHTSKAALADATLRVPYHKL